jgi:dihydroorotate dehydrogenase electron transfer subunit
MIVPDIFKISLHAPEICMTARPGQFVNIKLTEMKDPLLRRPFSIHRVSRERMEILFRVAGQGTRFLTTISENASLDLLGPLGRGFIMTDQSTVVLIAGGVGIAPLFWLAEVLVRNGKRAIVLMGAENKRLVFYERECRRLDAEVLVSTDDGSHGFRGSVTELLVSLLDEGKIPLETGYYACGPNPMLRTLASIAGSRRLSCQISIEEKMACGIGACLSCVCKVKPDVVIARRGLEGSHIQTSPDLPYGYALACADGPVFDIDEIAWDE